MINEKYLKNEEKIALSLRSLYSKYGYLPYKMSKFEEYDLYADKKDFLISDRIITFTDTAGKLMALKPDVTLSIIKHTANEAGTKQKVYYCENVYRVLGSAKEFNEIMQVGLECVGDIDAYDEYEVISLSAQSLEEISKSYVIEVSHMGILNAVLEKINKDSAFRTEILDAVKKKSKHEIEKTLERYSCNEMGELIYPLINVSANPECALSELEGLNVSDSFTGALSELKELFALLKDTPYYDRLRIDFSIVNDMNYYNGLVFNGYVEGVCECVLYGGRYDKLLKKMGREQGGIGFAIYTELLNGLNKSNQKYDVDVLLIYKDTSSIREVKATIEEQIKQGKSVSAQRAIPDKLRYRELLEI